jgi:altronate dehydratase small subunit
LDVTALDRLADSVTAAKVFHHSMALCPILALADQSVKETMSGRLVVVRHERPAFSGEVLLTWSPESVQHEVAKLRQTWALRGWTTLIIPGHIVWDEAFALEDEDQISFEVESLGHMAHTARILHPSWASVVPAHGQPVVKVHERDNVAVVLSPLRAGDSLRLQGQEIVARQAIPFGHKIALTEMAKDAPVIKYGEIIGQAGQPIQPGEHVHVHNFDSRRGRGDLEKPVPQTAK